MEKYKKYIQLQKSIEELEKEKEVLRDEIAKDLPDAGYKDETINVFWTKKKKWTYSSNVEVLSAKLKSTKEAEEKEGIATAVEVKQLTIKI
jgi:hypothetical protein